MRTIRFFCLVILAALPLTAVISFGGMSQAPKRTQSTLTRIEGKVVNLKGAGVQGVNIAIADVDVPGQKLAEAVTNFMGRYNKDVPATKNGYIVTPSKKKSTFAPENIKLHALGGLAEFKLTK
jgi:hypothetical protein